MTLPVLDAVTRRWLKRSASPYVPEIAAIAAALDYSGIWFLNGCYQWGCTALAREEDEGTAEREWQKADRAGHCCESKCSETCGLS